MIITELITCATEKLADVSDSPRLDAEVLLCHVLQKDRSYLITWPEKHIDHTSEETFNQYVTLRSQGHPIAHITGQREFWSLPLDVSKDTLIPRPDTELLVEQVLMHFPQNEDVRLADLGTGSGAIALAIAKEKPGWTVLAVDNAEAALRIAKNNATKLSINNTEFRLGHWCQALDHQPLDIIVSNPPYIADSDDHLQQGDVQFEPRSALVSADNGLQDLKEIAACSQQHLKPGGMLLVEHGYDQKQSVWDIFTHNHYREMQQIDDLSGNPRVTLGIK